MSSPEFEAGYEAGYRDGVGIVSPWAQILIALGALRDEMTPEDVIAVQRFAERLKNPTAPKSDKPSLAEQAEFIRSVFNRV